MLNFKNNSNLKLFEKLNKYRVILTLGQSDKARIKQALMQQIAITPQEQPDRKSAKFAFWPLISSRRFVLTFIIVLIFTTSSLTAYGSQASLPGEPLYKVKQVIEQARLETAITDYNTSIIETQIAHQRIDELVRLKEKQRNEKIPEAEAQANLRTSQAVTHLTEVQEKLQNKGNAKAAEKIQKRIEELNSKATARGIQIKAKNQQTNQATEGTGSTTTLEMDSKNVAAPKESTSPTKPQAPGRGPQR